MSLRYLAGVALLLAAAACSSSTNTLPPQTFAPATGSLPLRGFAAGGRGFTVKDFTYHIMPLRVRHAHANAGGGGLQYPDDLTNYGAPLMKAAAAHNIYVNCPAKESCWGAPEAFQTKLAGSKFAGMLTQYTGSAPSAYTFADSVNILWKIYPHTALYENDLFAIIHQVAAASKKTGLDNEYHVFLPKGTDTCFDFYAQCYSPDNPSTSAFCAYHGTVDYSDIGLVVYSIEPYQDIKGCLTKKSSGASELTNSTISTLAHETFESITDPGPKLAWYNFVGGEIGDECEFFVASVNLGGTVYNTQPMYSNKYHACATQ
ncbi:MAG: hypothetical protein JOY98_07275 [Candidatus Eremiobacteraeota bacterium]|nr:hypothetical protein [Candidatus Eremiobacteraeota bacterium]